MNALAENKYCICIIDTGANISAVKKSFIDTIPLKFAVYSKDRIRVENRTTEAMGGANIRILIGIIRINILNWINKNINFAETVELFVMDNLPADIILGLDLIKLFNLSISDKFRVFQTLDCRAHNLISRKRHNLTLKRDPWPLGHGLAEREANFTT